MKDLAEKNCHAFSPALKGESIEMFLIPFRAREKREHFKTLKDFLPLTL